MEFKDKIEYDGQGNDGAWFIYKYPKEEFLSDSQLIVKQGQQVIIYVTGRICDVFQPGRYILNEASLPLAEKAGTTLLIKIYFVNVSEIDMNWGTQNPFNIEDPKYGLILSIRAYGTYVLKIWNAKDFVTKLAGSIKKELARDQMFLARYLSGLLTSIIKSVIAKFMIQKKISFLEVTAYLDELSEKCQKAISKRFDRFGVEIQDFYVESITPPKNEYAMLRKYKEDLALGNGFYQQRRSYDIMENMSENPGAVSFVDAAKGFRMLQEADCLSRNRGYGSEFQSIFKMDYNYYVGERKSMIDILIMIASNDEEKAITSKDGWKYENFSVDQGYYVNEKNGISFALVRGYEMGESDAAIMAQKFIENLKPKVIAMAGFCAGQKEKVKLGDIIVANKVYSYDVGKQTSETMILPEISNYMLDERWLQFIERLEEGWMSNEDKTMISPVDFEWQMIELLTVLRRGISYYKELYDKNKYPDWTKIIEELQSKQLIRIEGETLVLTDTGKKYIDEYMVKNITNKSPKLKLRIGPIATGKNVQVWSRIFQALETKYDRKTCALDMESHVIGKLGSINRIPFIVVKGVGDFADDGKKFANRFIEYTSRMSCNFIMKLFSDDRFIPYWKKDREV